MSGRFLSLVLFVGLAGAVAALVPQIGALRLPANQQSYEPVQPIKYSHRLHAGELGIPCLYCHSAAETSRHAGIPSASVCMNCHQFVTAPLGAIRAEDVLAEKEKRRPRRIVSPELQKLYDALALGANLQRDPNREPRPIVWTKVHNLPDYVYFDHRAHVNAGVACQQCHGPVETMERVRQASDLSMGWCVDCHRTTTAARGMGRKANPLTDCATCHY